jgi:hypothetical protein
LTKIGKKKERRIYVKLIDAGPPWLLYTFVRFFYIIILSACFDFTCIEYTQYDTLLIQSMNLGTEGTLSLQKTLAEEHCGNKN